MKVEKSKSTYLFAALVFAVIGLLVYFLINSTNRDSSDINKNSENKDWSSKADEISTPNQSASKGVFELSPVESDISDGARIDIELAGEVFNLQLRELFVNPYVLPDKDGAYLYEKLSQKAATDPVAARLLSGLLTKCKGSFLDESKHKQSIQLLIDENLYPAANIDRPFKVSPESVDLIKEEFDQNFRQCKSLSDTQRKEAAVWARLAAEGGDYLGLEMLTKAPEITTDERIQAYHTKWEEFGDVYSLASLAVLMSGVGNRALSPLFSDLKPDPTKAYADFLISSKVEVAIAEQNEHPDLEKIRHEHSIFEQLLTSNLTVSEHFAAEKLAKKMLRTTEKCCSIDLSTSYQFSLKD